MFDASKPIAEFCADGETRVLKVWDSGLDISYPIYAAVKNALGGDYVIAFTRDGREFDDHTGLQLLNAADPASFPTEFAQAMGRIHRNEPKPVDWTKAISVYGEDGNASKVELIDHDETRYVVRWMHAAAGTSAPVKVIHTVDRNGEPFDGGMPWSIINTPPEPTSITIRGAIATAPNGEPVLITNSGSYISHWGVIQNGVNAFKERGYDVSAIQDFTLTAEVE